MQTHVVDKLLSFGLVVVGLLALVFGHLPENTMFIAYVVIIGGVLGLVNAQLLTPVLQILEKQLNVPLSVTSATTQPTTSQEVSHGTSYNTSSTSVVPSVGVNGYSMPHVSGTGGGNV